MADSPFSSVKVFISSPGDVGEEREIVRRTLERLARELGSQIQVDAFLWEANPLYATSDFQSQIDQANSNANDAKAAAMKASADAQAAATAARAAADAANRAAAEAKAASDKADRIFQKNLRK